MAASEVGQEHGTAILCILCGTVASRVQAGTVGTVLSSTDGVDTSRWPSVPATQLSCDIAIAGGGLGGLALAVGLKARGYDVHLFGKRKRRKL